MNTKHASINIEITDDHNDRKCSVTINTDMGTVSANGKLYPGEMRLITDIMTRLRELGYKGYSNPEGKEPQA